MIGQFVSLDDQLHISATPIVLVRTRLRCLRVDHFVGCQGKKGWSSSPMNDLVNRGLVTGNAQKGWDLTPEGLECADKCCARWDRFVEKVDNCVCLCAFCACACAC